MTRPVRLSRRFTQTAARLLAVALACAAFSCSLVGRSRHWLHTTAGLHIWYHLALFAVLGALALLASTRLSWRMAGVGAALLFGFATELSETGGNFASIEWNDVQMDCYGVAFGCLAVWLFSRTAGQQRGS